MIAAFRVSWLLKLNHFHLIKKFATIIQNSRLSSLKLKIKLNDNLNGRTLFRSSALSSFVYDGDEDTDTHGVVSIKF